MKQLLILLLTLALTSCITEKRRAKICNNCPSETTIIERDCTYIYRDSFPVMIPPDSTLLQLYLKCIDGKVTVVDYNLIAGKLIEMGYKFNDGEVTIVASTVDTAAIIARYEKEMRQQTRDVVKKVVITKEPEKSFRWLGLFYLACAIVILVIFIHSISKK